MSVRDFEKPIVKTQDIDAIVKQFRRDNVKRATYAGGVPNVTFIVEFDSEEPIALRIGNVGYTRREHLEFEVAVLSYLEQSGFKWSPHLVPLLDGSGWIGTWGKFPVVATRLIHGVTGDEVPITTQLCLEIGKAIGEMRYVLAKYDRFIPSEEDFWSRSERLLNELEAFSVELSWDISPSIIIDAYKAAKETVQAVAYSDEVLHTDVWPPNVMVLDGQLRGILDFDDLAVGPGILDLAAAIAEFGFDRISDVLLEQNVSAIIYGYNKVANPITHQTAQIILPLIEVSYCSWFACNAVHRVTFEESEIYYRRLDQLRNAQKRNDLAKKLVCIITST